MPQREYVHCFKCGTPLENPAFRQLEATTVFIDFAVCDDCRQAMLGNPDTKISIEITGECLHKMLKPRRGGYWQTEQIEHG